MPDRSRAGILPSTPHARSVARGDTPEDPPCPIVRVRGYSRVPLMPDRSHGGILATTPKADRSHAGILPSTSKGTDQT